MTITYKRVQSSTELLEAIRIRVDVFIIEQKCPPGWEPDEFDKDCEQYIAIKDTKIVATGRVRKFKGNKIERLAVVKEVRKQGIASGLLDFMIEDTKKRNLEKIWLQAQTYAKDLYEKKGFVQTGDEFDWDGIPHIDMELKQNA